MSDFAADPRPIAVLGATGMLGRPVAERLAADGARVRVLSRDPTRARAMLGDGFDYAVGEVRAPDTLEHALGGCRGVHINLRGTTLAGIDEVEAQGVGAVARAAAAAGVERITYLSGAGLEAGDRSLPYVRAKQAAEAAIQASGAPFTILRATHFMESLDLFVRGKAAELMGPQPNRYHYLAASDYARHVTRAYREPAAANTALTLLGPAPFTMREALQLYVRIARPDLRLRETPLAVVRVIARLTGNPQLRLATALFGAFRELPETGDRAQADALLGPAPTTLAAWCEARALSTKR